MARWRALAGLVVTGVLVGGASVSGRPAVAATGRGDMLQMYYTPPVLVIAGETVRIPVDATCVTPQGRACRATVTLRLQVNGTGRAQVAMSKASPHLAFDISGPARRAVGGAASSGAIGYSLEARAPDGTRLSYPGSGSLVSYVTRQLRVVRLRAVRFGHVRHGETRLALSWGSGRRGVGLVLGNESQTLGPMAFDVDAGDRVHLLDSQRDRVVVFAGGRLLRVATLPAGLHHDIGAAEDGSSYVLSGGDESRSVVIRRIGAGGETGDPTIVAPSLLGQIRSKAGSPLVHLLPMDAWLELSSPGTAPTIGRPTAQGPQVLSSATDDRVRLATVEGGPVVNPVELRSPYRFGELALAEPDGHGGYVAVVHVATDGPVPADQYQVVAVHGDGSLETFAVANQEFAETAPLSKFRLGPDGAVYQLASGPSGIRIVRYDITKGD
jgi:hypothetical protein